MNSAAENGYLHIVKWLHENGFNCTTSAMDNAARNGHLHIVKWLHENRTEGYSEWAMDDATRNGHLHIVEYLQSITI